jgi:hypothetical protein
MAAIGKAMKAGISVIDPIIEAIIMPCQPAFWPKRWDITSGLSRAKTIPKKDKMVKIL